MKNRFSKWLSILLSLCMIISMTSFVVVADDGTAGLAAVTEYYVKKGGSGDGRSADAPIGTIPGVVSNINADGWGEGDLVTVYVIDSGEGLKEVIDSDCVIGYGNNNYGQAPAHTATIKWTSYDPETVTSIIGHVNWQGPDANGSHWVVMGPSIFEDINIVDMRNSKNGGTDIYLNHYPVEFHNVKFGDLRGVNETNYTTGTVFYPSSTHFALGMIRGRTTVNRDQYVYLDNADIIGDYINVLGYNDTAANQGTSGSVTLEIGSGTLKNLHISGSNAVETEVIGGDLSIILGEGVTVNKIGTGSIPVVKGVFNLIQNYGATIPTGYTDTPWTDALKTEKAPFYNVIAGSPDISISTTDEAGVFAVEGDGIAFAVSADRKTIYYGEGEVALEPGVVTVNVAADLDAVKEAAGAPESDLFGNKLQGWVEDGEGKLKAVYGEGSTEAAAVFYAQFGGTGVGLSEDAPAGSLATLVELINTEFGAGDEVTIKVIPAENQPTDGKWDSAEDSVFLQLGGIPAHAATITITSIDADNKSYVAFENVWAESGAGNHWINNGPKVMKDITIIDNRTDNATRDINLNYHSCKFDNANIVVIPKVNGYAFTNWKERSGHFSIGGNRSNGTFATSDTVVKLDKTVIESSNDINVSGYADGNQTTLTTPGHVTVELADGNLKVFRIDNNKAGFVNTYSGNLNIIFNGTTVDTFNQNNVATVRGVANIIKNNATVPATPEINGVVYDITAGEDVVVSLTEEDGVFNVACDGIAYAVSENGRKIFYGEDTITLEPGVYTINVAASVDEIIANAEEPSHTTAYEFGGWDTSVDGVITAILTYVGSGDGAYYFVMGGGKGNGLSPDSPAGSISEVVDRINMAGYTAGDEVTIYVMDMCDEPYKYDINGKSVVGINFYGNQNTRQYVSAVTPWATETRPQPVACAADITIAAYDYETTGKNTWLIWNSILGFNTNMNFVSNYTFENINLLGPRPYDREYFINGYDVTFNNCEFYFLTKDAHSNSGAYDGGLYGRQKFMLAGSAGGGGKLTINSPYTQEGEYGIHVAGTGGGTYTKPVVVDIAHEDISTQVYFGGSANANFNAGFSLVVGAGAEVTAFAKKDNIVNINGYQLLAMEGDAVFGYELPENVAITGGKWIMQVDSDAMFIEPTDTIGTFKIKDENLAAIAGNKETGAMYFSADGLLTLPAGTYTVSSLPADQLEDMKVDVYFDNEPATGSHYAGYPVYLPVLADKAAYKFVGWEYEDIETGEYIPVGAGVNFDIPEGATEIFFYSLYDPFEDTTVAYVDQANGSDDNDGSEYAPYQTFAAAFAKVLAAEESIKKVCVIGYYGLGNTSFPTNNVPVIVTGEGADKTTLDINNDCIAVNGPVTFENLKFAQTTSAGGKVLYTRTNHVTFGEGLEIDGKFALRIGEASATTGPIAATFKSGTFPGVELGHFWCQGKRGTVTTADIVVDGATINSFNFTSNGWLTEQIGCDYTGAVNISVNSGTVGSIGVDTGHRYAEFKDSVTVILNNGQESIKVSEALTAPNGAWSIVGDSTIGMITTTSVPGTFAIGGEKTALVTNVITNAQYVSSQGEITLPAGQYKVEYVDKVYYVNDGERITVYNDCTIDLSTVKHVEKEGNLFLGWTFEDGTPCDINAVVNEGDTLVANFVEFNAAEDFAIIGAQIRTSGVQGLRFIVEKKNDFFASLPEVSEFGTLVLPTQATWGRDMLLTKSGNEYVPAGQVAEWQWDAATKLVFTPKSTNGYTPAKVVGERLFNVTDDSEQYTICITNITEDKYYRYYSVKGYAIYKDYNGIEHVLYSDYYQTNIYNVAVKALEAGEEPAATFEAIKEYYEVDRKEAYMAENYNNRVLLSGYESTSDKDPNHAMYQLANGMKIREVEIESGTEGDAVEIVHFADTHLNYINQKDMDLNDINTLSTYRGRAWLRNGSSVPNIARMMEYASFFDKAVITGDVMDYFSWGCAEIMQKMIVDQSKQQGNQVLMAMGNHEPAELMQSDTAGLTNRYTLEYKYEVLQAMWTNDVYYHSEILTNDNGDEKVMIVVLDNQRDSYWGDIQSVPFARDIEIAREKGLPILIFEHDPICTRNPNETAATYFYEGGDTSGIPCDMSNRFAGRPAQASDADTMKVYNLIVQNPDVIKGVFCGHWHNHMYTEILAQNADGSFMMEGGKYVVIPQYVVTANAYGQGNAIKITVK